MNHACQNGKAASFETAFPFLIDLASSGPPSKVSFRLLRIAELGGIAVFRRRRRPAVCFAASHIHPLATILPAANWCSPDLPNDVRFSCPLGPNWASVFAACSNLPPGSRPSRAARRPTIARSRSVRGISSHSPLPAFRKGRQLGFPETKRFMPDKRHPWYNEKTNDERRYPTVETTDKKTDAFV